MSDAQASVQKQLRSALARAAGCTALYGALHLVVPGGEATLFLLNSLVSGAFGLATVVGELRASSSSASSSSPEEDDVDLRTWHPAHLDPAFSLLSGYLAYDLARPWLARPSPGSRRPESNPPDVVAHHVFALLGALAVQGVRRLSYLPAGTLLSEWSLVGVLLARRAKAAGARTGGDTPLPRGPVLVRLASALLLRTALVPLLAARLVARLRAQLRRREGAGADVGPAALWRYVREVAPAWVPLAVLNNLVVFTALNLFWTAHIVKSSGALLRRTNARVERI